MTLSAGLVLGILLIAFILFLSGKLRPDLIALMVMLTLVITHVIEPKQAFEGFSSFAVMAIAGLLVIGKGLERTGVVKWVAKRLEGITGNSYNKLLLTTTSIPGILSGFVNIVAAASFFIPVIIRLCLKLKISPSKVLLPMAVLALCGANLTLIGASHNLVVHSLLEESQGAGFEFFEFSLLGLAWLIIALIYVFFIGKHLLPEREEMKHPREATITSNLIDDYEIKDRLFEVWVSGEFEESENRIKDMKLQKDYGLSVLEIVREEDHFLNIERDFEINREDQLLLQGNREAVMKFCNSYRGLSFMGAPRSEEKYPISSAELAEAVVPPRSEVIGKTSRELNFKSKYGLRMIAYYRVICKPRLNHIWQYFPWLIKNFLRAHLIK